MKKQYGSLSPEERASVAAKERQQNRKYNRRFIYPDTQHDALHGHLTRRMYPIEDFRLINNRSKGLKLIKRANYYPGVMDFMRWYTVNAEPKDSLGMLMLMRPDKLNRSILNSLYEIAESMGQHWTRAQSPATGNREMNHFDWNVLDILKQSIGESRLASMQNKIYNTPLLSTHVVVYRAGLTDLLVDTVGRDKVRARIPDVDDDSLKDLIRNNQKVREAHTWLRQKALATEARQRFKGKLQVVMDYPMVATVLELIDGAPHSLKQFNQWCEFDWERFDVDPQTNRFFCPYTGVIRRRMFNEEVQASKSLDIRNFHRHWKRYVLEQAGGADVLKGGRGPLMVEFAEERRKVLGVPDEHAFLYASSSLMVGAGHRHLDWMALVCLLLGVEFRESLVAAEIQCLTEID